MYISYTESLWFSVYHFKKEEKFPNVPKCYKLLTTKRLLTSSLSYKKREKEVIVYTD